MSNQAWQITSPGTLSLVTLPGIPSPGPNQALVRIQAVSLNFRDVLVSDHNPSYPIQAKPNLTPCSDGAGTIEEAGPGSKWKKGDKVFIHPNSWKTGDDPRDFDMSKTMGGGATDGTLRKFIVWDDDRLVKAPEGISIEQAATLYTAGATAWNALFHGKMKLEPGMTILTQGTGGVSCFTIQLASALGATVVATSSSNEKLEVAKKLGATHLINYSKHPSWADEVLKVTDNKGVDITVEVVGASSIVQSIKATRHGGLISLVGMLSEDPYQAVNIMHPLLFKSQTIQAFLGAGSKQMSDELSAFVEKHGIHPLVAKVYEFEDADKAIRAAAKLSVPGKVVVKV